MKKFKKPLIRKGFIARTHAGQKAYDSYKQTTKINDDCVFCKPKEMKEPVERGDFLIIGNKFGYEWWDGCEVLEHLMLVPKRHVGSINELSDSEKAQYVSLLGEYEENGYVIYSRAVSGHTRSITHLHTHLMKLDTKIIKSLIYLERPHLLLYRK